MKNIANTPPMGWNSWDCYGAGVTEEIVRKNAKYVAEHMKQSGWEYIVVDIQWYEPNADDSVYHPFVPLCMDKYGRLQPAENRFPSAKGGYGFKKLADYIHRLGLKFGIHIMRGIPRQAVHQNLPIYGSEYSARNVAHPYSICPWNTDMYGLNPLVSGAQDYYNSLFQMYAEWGIDFIKVDDISYTDFGKDTYAGRHEIEMIGQAIQSCGRDIVLSLSCGPTPIEHTEHLKKYSNMWRLTADLWDTWDDIYNMFEKCCIWSKHAEKGHWPDADMLPLGHISIIGHEHGIGNRYTRLSHDEQQTMMTLWCIARSPLMFGGECNDNDEWTLNLLTNDEVLRLVQYGHQQKQIFRGGYNDQFIIWKSFDSEDGSEYFAFFNTWNTNTEIKVNFELLNLNGNYHIRDLWEHKDIGTFDCNFEIMIPRHGAKLYKFKKM